MKSPRTSLAARYSVAVILFLSCLMILMASAVSISTSSSAGPASFAPGARVEASTAPKTAEPTLIAPTTGPTVTATKAVDVHTHAHLGDTLTYTVVISNTGTAAATGVNFTDTIDPNTTLVPNSLLISPIAIDDTYNTIGNVNISVPAGSGVIQNDLNPGGMGTLTVTQVNGGAVGSPVATTHGSVTMAADGSFTYNPTAAFTGGSDSFTYTLGNGTGKTDMATVTINISGLIWFVDDSPGANGDGRLSSPFRTLVGGANPLAGTVANDAIFIYTGTSNYTGGLTLTSGEKLIGQGAGASILSITGFSTPSGTNLLPNTGGTNPTIAAAVDNITLGSGNTVRGVTLNVTAVAATALTGSSFGTLTLAETTIGGTNGRALSLTTGTLTGPVSSTAAFTSISSTNSSLTGITLTTVAGNMSSGSTTITNSTGIGLSVNTSSAAFNFATTSVTGSGGTGISLLTNTGTITFAGVTITPDSGQRGLLATDNTNTITITSGAITTTTNVGVEITRSSLTTPLVISLTSVSANGGASGIILTNTSGSFTVVGDGSNTNNSSGGTIQNSTNNGITLSNALNISLTSINIQSSAHSGIKGSSNVQNFSLTHSTVNNSGTASGTGDSNVAFNAGAYAPTVGNEKNLTGTATITNNTLTNAFFHGVDIFQFDGTISNVNISNNTITSSTSQATSKGDGIRLVGFGSASTVANYSKGTINQNQITNFPSDAGIFFAGGNATSTSAPAGTYGSDTSANAIAITNNTIAGQSAANGMGTQGIFTSLNGRGTGDFVITGNSITNVKGIGIATGSNGLTTYTGIITGNTINAHNINASAGIGGGTTDTFATSDTPTYNARIGDGTAGGANHISNTDGNGILINSINGLGHTNVRILTNTVAAPIDSPPSGTTYGIRVAEGNINSSGDAICLEISGNTTAGDNDGAGTIASGIGLRKQTAAQVFGIVGLPAGSTATPNVENYVNSQNPGSASGSFGVGGTTLISSTSGFSSCTEPAGLSFNDVAISSAGGGVATSSKKGATDDSAESAGVLSTLVAHNGKGPGGDNIPKLSQAELTWMTQAALDRWRQAGISAEDLARLQAVTFEVGDLPDGQIATASSVSITVDQTAAGYGWFFDQTPNEDSEFDVPVPNRELQTTEYSPAYGKMDLLTVLMRELGTVYLQGKTRVPKQLRPLMNSLLLPGVRRLPDPAQAQMPSPQSEVQSAPQTAPSGAASQTSGSSSARGKGGQVSPSSAVRIQSGDTINQNLGTLPQGKSITMMFQVTVNNNFPTSPPAGVIQVCNQGTVTGTNFTVVNGISTTPNTDDPSTGASNDATCTTLCVPPVVTTAITNQQVAKGSTATFTTTVQGSVPFTFVWKKGGTTLVSGTSLGGRATISTSTNNANSTTTSTLTITNTVLTDSDTYTVDPTDACSVAVSTESATLTVVAPPTVSKSFGASSIPLNGSTTLTLTLTNPNASVTLTGVNFSDNLVAGLEVANPAGISSTCTGTWNATPGDTTLNFGGGTLAPNTSCTLMVNIKGTSVGVKSNTTNAPQSTEGGTGVASNTTTLTVVGPPTISKSFASSTVALNGTVNLNFTITNPNNFTGGDLTGIGFTDTLPAGLTVADSGPTATCGGGMLTTVNATGKITLTGASIVHNAGGNANCTFSVPVTGTTAGVKMNTTGVITSNEGGTGATSNTASITVLAPPTISKSFGATNIAVGATTSLTFTITNPNSTASLTGVGFTDTLPAGLTAANNAGSSQCGGTLTVTGNNLITLSGATIASSGTCQFSVTVTGTTSGVKNNTTGAVTSTNGGTGTTSNTATVTVASPPTLSKSFGASAVTVGGTTSLTFTITNPNSSLGLTGISFTDTLPAGITVATGSASTCGGTVTTTAPSAISFSGGTLAASGSCNFSVTVTGSAAGVWPNTSGVISSNESGAGATSNTATLTVIGPASISKAFVSTVAIAASPNGATESGTTVTITTTTPHGFSAGESVVIASVGVAGYNGTFTIASVPTATMFTYTASSGLASSGGGMATAGIATMPLGGIATVSITITNPNTTTSLTGVGFTDSLPSGLQVAGTPNASSSCGGTFTPLAGDTTLTFSGATLGPSGTCTVKVDVTGTTAGVKDNITSGVSSNEGGTGAPSNTATITVLSPPTISKAFNPTSIALGATSQLSFTITNPNATVALTGVGFTDTLPSGVTAANNAGSSQCGGTLTVTGNNLITLSGATVAGGGTCQFSVTVTGATAGVKNNTTGAVTSDNGGTGTTSNTATLSVAAAPTISKSFDASSILLGATTNVNFTITNPNSSVSLTGISFTDTLPAGITVANSGPTAACGGTVTTTAPSTISFSGGTLATSGNCSFSIAVTGSTAGVWNNTTGVISSNESGAGATSNTATLTVVGPPSISKSFDAATIPLNGTSVLSFTVTNPNTTTAFTGVTFTDTLPAGLTVPNGSSSVCGGGTLTTTAPDTITLTGGAIGASSNCLITVTVTGATAGVKNNTSGNVSAANGGTGNTASASITVVAPPTISKSFNPTSIPLNGTSSLTFTITNPNTTVSLTGVSFTDTLPSGVTVADATTSQCGGTLTTTNATGMIVLTGATIASSGTCQFSVTVTGATAGVKNNQTAAVTSTNGGTGSTSNVATLTVAAAPTVSKSFGASSILLNATTSLTFSITNPNATQGLTGIAFTDTLPAGITVATSGPTATCGGTLTTTAPSTITFSSGTLAGGANCSFNVTVTGSTTGVWNNTTGAISSNESGTGATSNTATLTVVGPPSISKSFNAATIPLGGTSVLSFTVTNPNTTTSLTGVAFTDTLPAGLTVATGTSSQCSGTLTTTAPNQISFSGGSLASSGNCTITVTVTGATAGVKNNTSGTVSASNSGTGNTAMASITVVAPPMISKAFNPSTIVPNGNSSLMFTITNPNSTVALTGVSFTDTLPSGVIVGDSSTSQCGGTLTTTNATGVIMLNGASIAAGGMCQFSVTVMGTGSGVKHNTTGAVTSTNGGTGNMASADLTVGIPPTITCPTGPVMADAASGQCSATVTFTVTATGTPSPTVTCSPASGTVFPVGTTTVSCTASNGVPPDASCSFTVQVKDTQAPVFPNGCPSPITVVAQPSCPFATTAPVSFTTPTATDNCGTPTVVCSPPAGSQFPVGTTTVTCTATDASTNMTTCTFGVNVFSFCLQDDSSPGNVVFVNASTGDFVFCSGGVQIASGRGTLTVRGCQFGIEASKGDRKVHIGGDTSANNGLGAGNAVINKTNGHMVIQITDRNMSNNTCQCSPPPPQSIPREKPDPGKRINGN